MYELIDTGGSRSFPEPHEVLARASGEGETVLIIGMQVAEALEKLPAAERYTAIVIELGAECLGTHTGESFWRCKLNASESAPRSAKRCRPEQPRQFPGGALCQTARIIGSLSCSKRRGSRRRHRSSLRHWTRSSSRSSAS